MKKNHLDGGLNIRNIKQNKKDIVEIITLFILIFVIFLLVDLELTEKLILVLSLFLVPKILENIYNFLYNNLYKYKAFSIIVISLYTISYIFVLYNYNHTKIVENNDKYLLINILLFMYVFINIVLWMISYIKPELNKNKNTRIIYSFVYMHIISFIFIVFFPTINIDDYTSSIIYSFIFLAIIGIMYFLINNVAFTNIINGSKILLLFFALLIYIIVLATIDGESSFINHDNLFYYYISFVLFLSYFIKFIFYTFSNLLILNETSENNMVPNIFRLSLNLNSSKEKVSIDDRLNEIRYFISKGEEIKEEDYLLLAIHEDYRILNKNVNMIVTHEDYKHSEDTVFQHAILLNSTNQDSYSNLNIRLLNIKSKKISNYIVEIKNKQIFFIDRIDSYYNWYENILGTYHSRFVEAMKYDKYSSDHFKTSYPNSNLNKIKLITARHLQIYLDKDLTLKRNCLNYLESDFGYGKTTIISNLLNNYKSIYYFSLDSHDSRNNIYERLYFDATYKPSKLRTKVTISMFGLLGTVLLLPIFSQYLTSINQNGFTNYLFILVIIIIIVISLIILYQYDIILAMNFTNRYIKDTTYIQKTLNYFNRKRIILVIEDFDRTNNVDRFESNMNFFTKLSEEFNYNRYNQEILVTGSKFNKYTKNIYKINNFKIEELPFNDYFEKTFKKSIDLDLTKELELLQKYYYGLYNNNDFLPPKEGNISKSENFRILKSKIPNVKF